MVDSRTHAFAKGSIQHAAIWNTALSDAELTAIQTARMVCSRLLPRLRQPLHNTNASTRITYPYPYCHPCRYSYGYGHAYRYSHGYGHTDTDSYATPAPTSAPTPSGIPAWPLKVSASHYYLTYQDTHSVSDGRRQRKLELGKRKPMNTEYSREP